MGDVTFIGDELTGAGFRLAGLRVYTPKPDRVPELFRQALADASLLILTPDVARRLPGKALRDAMTRATPPVAIVPAATGTAPPSELVREVRLTLGMEA